MRLLLCLIISCFYSTSVFAQSYSSQGALSTTVRGQIAQDSFEPTPGSDDPEKQRCLVLEQSCSDATASCEVLNDYCLSARSELEVAQELLRMLQDLLLDCLAVSGRDCSAHQSSVNDQLEHVQFLLENAAYHCQQAASVCSDRDSVCEDFARQCPRVA